MFIIREDQFAAFDSVAEKDLQDRTIEHLRENHSEEIVILPDGEFSIQEIPDERLLEMVKLGFKRARKFGFTWESNLVSFVVLMFTIAPNFDDQPAINKVLSDESIEADLRLDTVWERTNDEDWEMVNEQYETEYWQY